MEAVTDGATTNKIMEENNSDTAGGENHPVDSTDRKNKNRQ